MSTGNSYTVVVWGDSIAAGNSQYQWPALAQRVCQVATNTGQAVCVMNEGVGGKPAAQARYEFEERVLKHKPDLVIIQFGFNDQRFNGSREDKPLSTVEEFEQHLLAMIDDCLKQANAKVVVFGNHKARSAIRLPSGLTYDEARQAYSSAARRAAEARGVAFHDMAEQLALPEARWTDFVCEDGVHLSPLGFYAYAHLGANIIQQVRMA